jgi:hypothetical protein
MSWFADSIFPRAEFVGTVRSCFVSSNAPSSSSFSASDLAINFAYFYMAYFQKEHRDTLWSLYEESIELSVGQQVTEKYLDTPKS